MENLRALLAVANHFKLAIHQGDAKNAFLHATLKHDIYVKQPEGFVDPDHPEMVYKLVKSLYGLKQAPYEWNQLLDKHLRLNGFKALAADPCVYVKFENGKPMIIALYVDDTIFITEPSLMAKLKKVLSSKFKMKDLGEARYILGIEVQRDAKTGRMYLRQRHKIEEILKRFNLEDIKPTKTPMEAKFQLPVLEKTPSDCTRLPFRALVGSLSYLAHATRPDIVYAVNYLSRFNKSYGRPHWEAAKRVLRYLQGTKDYAICYERSSGKGRHQIPTPIGYCDADWGKNDEDAKSVTGLMVKLCNGPILWKSSRQDSVALSSTESELNAMSEIVRHTAGLRILLEPLGLGISGPFTVFSDSQSAIKTIRNRASSYKSRMKHYAVKLAYLREEYENGNFNPQFCPTGDMPADGFTKPLGPTRFIHLRDKIGLRLTEH